MWWLKCHCVEPRLLAGWHGARCARITNARNLQTVVLARRLLVVKFLTYKILIVVKESNSNFAKIEVFSIKSQFIC